MSFLLLFVCGVAGGLLGGMGLGGGTALIPLLTLVCGVEQSAAQGVNLLAFLPAAVLALSVHAKSGLLGTRGILPLILPALLFSALGALVAVHVKNGLLGRAFGIFLVVLALFWLRRAFSVRQIGQKSDGKISYL